MSEIDKVLTGFTEKIEYVRKVSMGVPKLFRVNLAVPIVDQIYNISGNLFYVWSAPDESSYITIKVNQTSEPPINYSALTGLITPFEKLLITTPAGQTGDIEIMYGTEAPDFLRIIDNRSSTVAGVGGVLDELRGDMVAENSGAEQTIGNAAAVLALPANAARKGCCLQAKAANAGIIYIGFANTVMPNNWVAELQGGGVFTIDDYRGPLYARADAAAQLLGWGEW